MAPTDKPAANRPSIFRNETVSEGTGVLDTLVEATQLRKKESFRLSSERHMEIARKPEGDILTIKSPDDVVELEVLITDKGPVLRFRSTDIQLQSQGSVAIDCEDFRVQARGSIVQQAEGHIEVKAREDLELSGVQSTLKATRGDVEVKANDDVRVKGERIRLNC